MEILKTGTMPDGTHVQLEEWKDDYDFMPYGNVVASYPKSKMIHEGRYSPKAIVTAKESDFVHIWFSAEDVETVMEAIRKSNKIKLAVK